MSRSTKSIKNLKTAIIGQGFGLMVSFISRIIFIKILGSEYLGLNGLFANILTVLSLAELGVGEAITFSLYKPLANKDIVKSKMLMQFYKKVYSIIGIVIILLGISITPFLHFFIKELPNINNIRLIYVMFVVNTAVSYFFSYKRNLIIADQNRYIATIYRYTFYFFLNIIQIFCLFLTKNYIIYLIIQILFTLLENIFISCKANKLYPYLKDKDNIKIDRSTKNEIKKNTKAMMMHKVGSVVITSTDNILISSFIGLTAVGLYSNYYMIISALNTIFGQVFNSLTASIGNLYACTSKEKQHNVFKKIFFVDFWIYGFSTICLICLFNPFIELWIGKEYLFSMDIVLILVINFYIYGMRKSVLTFREAAGLFYKDRWKAIIEAIANLIFSILLAFKFGTLGIFIGTFISSVAICVWIEPYVLYKYGFKENLSLYFKSYFKYLFCTIFVGLLCYTLCKFVTLNNSLIVILIKLAICCIVSNTIFYFIFRKSDEFNYFCGKLLKKKKQ